VKAIRVNAAQPDNTMGRELVVWIIWNAPDNELTCVVILQTDGRFAVQIRNGDTAMHTLLCETAEEASETSEGLWRLYTVRNAQPRVAGIDRHN